jgi:ligand-binding sensor domain-containing protein/putative methionine-R-sulfoxide reductase with GAF domain
MLRLLILIVILKIGLLLPMSAQQYDFRQYSIEQGLPQSQVINLLVDKRGFLWGSTYAGGFFRFEGTKFINFDRQNSPIIGTIASMVMTRTDAMFLITENGVLWRFDGYNYQEFSAEYQRQLPKGFTAFNYMLQAAHNDWFFLQLFDNQGNSQLLLFDGKQFVNYTEKYKKNFLLLTLSPNKDLFLSTKDEGVFLLQKDVLVPAPFQKHPIFGKDIPLIVGVLKPNKLLVAVVSPSTQTQNRSTPRLLVYQDQKFTPFELPTTITDYLEQGLGFYEDSRGEIWIYNPTNWESEFGLWRYRNGEFIHYNAKNGLINNNIIRVIEDVEGNIWLSTSGSEIIRFGGDKFLHFTKDTGLQDEVVWQFWQAPNKAMYMGTGTGVAKVQDNRMKFMPFRATDHLSINAGNKIYKGGLLLTYTDSRKDNGVLVFDENEKVTPLVRHLGLPQEFTYAFFQGYKGESILLTTNKGVVLYHQKNKYITEQQDSLLSRFNPKKSQLRYLGTDIKGHEWFQKIQNNELVVHEPNQLKIDKNKPFHAQLRTLKNSPPVRVYKMLGDTQGRSWFVTIDDGLYLTNGQQKARHITPEQGLSSLACYELLEDKNGNIWVGTQKGIDKVNISPDGSIKIRQYGKSEGFFGEETNSGAALEDADGNLWFGHIKGATRYNPLADQQVATPPTLYLTGIRLFSKEVNWQDSLKAYHKGVDKWFSLPQQLTLPYHINHISFDFTALSYKNPERVVYQWKLEGAYNEWLPVTDNPEAVFTNLPYGTYTFYLRAANGEGTWTTTPLTYKFTIMPPFWATWWFRGFVLLVVLLATYLFTKWRLRTIEAEKEELDFLIKQRTEEIENQKNEIAAQRDNLSGLNAAMALQKEEIETQRDKLERSFQNLQILSDIVREITATLNTKQIIGTVYQRINALMKAEGFGIGLYNKEKNCLDFEGYIENGVELAFHQDELYPVTCFSAWCFVHQQEIIMNDIAAEYHHYLPDRQTPKVGETLQSIIYLPLVTCDKLIGVITVQSFSKNAYSDQDLTLLRNYS